MDRGNQIIEAAHSKEQAPGLSQFARNQKIVNSAYGLGFIEGVQWADANRWIDIKIEQPADEEMVIVLTSWGKIGLCLRRHGEWVTETDEVLKYEVTHWMLLPTTINN